MSETACAHKNPQRECCTLNLNIFILYVFVYYKLYEKNTRYVSVLHFLGFPKGKCHQNQTFRLTLSLNFELQVQAVYYIKRVFKHPYHRNTDEKKIIYYLHLSLYKYYQVNTIYKCKIIHMYSKGLGEERYVCRGRCFLRRKWGRRKRPI